MTVRKFLAVISATVLLPAASFLVMLAPFIYFIEKIFFYLFSILLIYLILYKINWLETKRTLKIVYFILLYSLGSICFLLYCVGIIINQRQLRERDIYTSGIYIVEQTCWDSHFDVVLIRYNLSGIQKGDRLFHRGLLCKFQIKKINDEVFLDSFCDNQQSDDVIKHRIKLNN